MKKSYFYKLKEKFRIKKFDSVQPSGTWIFVITLNIIGLLGFLVLKFYGIIYLIKINLVINKIIKFIFYIIRSLFIDLIVSFL